MNTVFLRVIEADDKGPALLALIRQPQDARNKQRFAIDPMTFGSVPRSPFAYWVPTALRRSFACNPPLKSERRFAARGPYTLNDFRFVRLGPEVDPSQIKNERADTVGNRAWVRFLKGGAFSRYYADPCLVIDWSGEGKSLKALVSAYRDSKGWGPNWTAAINGYEYYFRPGLTWTHRTTSALSMRAMPPGCIFSAKGPALIIEDAEERLALLALGNSRVFQAIFEISLGAVDAAARSYDVGIMQRLPVPTLDDTEESALGVLARTGWRKRRDLDRTVETSCAFVLPALLQVAGANLERRTETWEKHVGAVQAEVASIQGEIDERCFRLYGVDQAGRLGTTEAFGGKATESESSGGVEEADDDIGDDIGGDANQDQSVADVSSLAMEILSWAVGVAFGRFDVRLATGARPLPPEPEPFDPLPVCSAGMLTGDNGLPLVRAPSGYSLVFPESGVLVEDPGHSHDLTAAVRAVFDVVFGADADRWWGDVAAVLDPKDHELRGWLAGSFFEHHLKRYSRSRRKAPIFWQLSTPSLQYSVWLYAHRLTRDSFFQLQNDVIGPKLIHEERRLGTLIQSTGGSPSGAERREIAAQETLIEELRTMLDEVKRIAPLWNPNLDDGVVLTMAPLWRLVPQHKPWQKELKSKLDELVAGHYDWAHVAMHLWPERVVPKCATDRSLAIAHGLEEVLWVENADGKWKPRETPVRAIDDLIRERTSPAVKAALKSLLEAPAAARAGRGERAASAAARRARA